MKILIIEATAEELKANRTVMDSVNSFTDFLCGVNNIDYAKAFASMNESNEEAEEEM